MLIVLNMVHQTLIHMRMTRQHNPPAHQALRTLVGDSATMVVDEGHPVTRQDFVNSCRGELSKTVN